MILLGKALAGGLYPVSTHAVNTSIINNYYYSIVTSRTPLAEDEAAD